MSRDRRTQSGRASAESVVDIFRQASAGTTNDALLLYIANYCLGGIEGRTNDQIFEVMDKQDDEYVGIAEIQNARTLEQLDSAMIQKLQKKLASHKISYSVVAYSHKDHWEKTQPNPNMRAVVNEMCRELFAKWDAPNYGTEP